ncbi:hypothetical protein L596_010794 [Steinernema carpocapsae]|uniref:Uncharacterized protein n=1 Tax=Steinernema carpocapsae TaxID=34508 RepID=A0A4U5PJE3_STECR|nr:hypothetical protein L596_010794 [Steinernema carpocapsae]
MTLAQILSQFKFVLESLVLQGLNLANRSFFCALMSVSTPDDLRESGNEALKAGDHLKAAEDYTSALQLDPEPKLRATLYRNRSLARLKLEEYEGCEGDCTKALEFDGADSKSLYRRALSREQLDNIKGAFEDAREANRLQPKDKNVLDLLERLLKTNAERQKKLQSAEHKAEEMRKVAFDKADDEQQLKALNNLLVLARDSETGAVSVWQNGVVIARLLRIVEEKSFNDEQAIAAIRVIDELCRSHKRAIKLIEMLGIPKLTRGHARERFLPGRLGNRPPAPLQRHLAHGSHEKHQARPGMVRGEQDPHHSPDPGARGDAHVAGVQRQGP